MNGKTRSEVESGFVVDFIQKYYAVAGPSLSVQRSHTDWESNPDTSKVLVGAK